MADTEIFVKLTTLLKDKIDHILADPRCPSNLNACLTNLDKKDSIPYSLIKQIHGFISSKDGSREVYLHEFLEGSDVVLPEVPRTERNPILEARCQRLQAQHQNAVYKKMVEGIDVKDNFDRSDMKSFGKEMKEVNKQLVSVFNFLVTVGGAFAFGYKAMEYSMEIPNVPAQMCSGLVLSTLVFFADLYFLVRYNIE